MGKSVDKKRKHEEEVEESYDGEEENYNEEENYDEEENYNEEENEETEDSNYDADSTSQPDKKKIKMEKKSKAVKRQEKVERKTKIDQFFPIVNDAKLIWIKLKETKKDKDERAKLSQELFNKLKGNMLNVVLKHDASRFVQTLLKYGTHDHRLQIFQELKGHEILISKGHYGRFLVLKLLKYGDKEHRDKIIQTYYGKIFNLISHKESAKIVEYIYAEIADKVQKTAIVEEFYGSEFRLFKSKTPRTLSQYLAENPNKQQALLENLTNSLTKLLSSKGEHLAKFTIIHHILNEFFKHAPTESCVDMAETLSSIILPMLHTKEGAMVGYYVASYGTPKTRKAIVKSLKGFFPEVAEQEFGYLLLVRLLDVVDDTQLLIKSVINELLPKLPQLAVNKYGYLWIMQILAPYTPQNFSAPTIQLMSLNMKSSSASEEFSISKKDRPVRRKELLAFIGPKLLELCNNHTEELVSSKWGMRVLCQTLSKVEGSKKSLMKKILSFMTPELFNGETGSLIQSLLKSEYVKTDTEFSVGMLKQFQWLSLALKSSNTVFVYRDLLNVIPDDNSDKQKAVAELKKSAKQLQATKYPGVDSLLNLKKA
ncbi:Pumilio RNA-binding region-containing protein [Tieghemostelium lacteum]|uniref:Pumilio RNA-binding region-containing protein n=1 Tax=Tieghemostelium lacteum TaxID=361077 RepID=A0A152AA38_TIELA|nr:Pumilio RNA-binding region-containing protein [Tieghemostelium lacteum]|eukprot:KYR03092.1 Pumilio RNA-binding region-containing protein [Tieghemostelium lacteum]